MQELIFLSELKTSQIEQKIHCIFKNIVTLLTTYILSIYIVAAACGYVHSNREHSSWNVCILKFYL